MSKLDLNTRWFICFLALIIACWFSVFLGAQPQPRMELESPNWLLVEFDNGSQWYLDGAKIDSIWAVPENEQEAVGAKVVIYIAGHRIRVPHSIEALKTRTFRPDMPIFKRKPGTE